MSSADVARTWLGVALIAVVLSGLGVRRRLAVCVTFVAYLVVVGVSDALMVAWPDRFFRQGFWILKESVLNLLKLAMGLELMVRIFRHFPTAYAATRSVVALVVVGLAFLVWSSLEKGTEYRTVVGTLSPHVIDATVWLFISLGAASLWYHLPLDSMHKAILIGLVPYLLVFSLALRALGAMGWERGDVFNTAAPLAYQVMLVYWAFAAWKKAPGDEGTRVKRMLPPAA